MLEEHQDGECGGKSMTMMPFIPAVPAVGSGAVQIFSHGIKAFMPKMMAGLNNPVFQAVGISEIIDNLQDLFGNPSDPSEQQGLEEIAKTIGHFLNDPTILWPRDNEGNPIVPQYLTIDLNRGRAWYTKGYTSRKGANAAYKRGRAHGRNSRRMRVRGTGSV